MVVRFTSSEGFLDTNKWEAVSAPESVWMFGRREKIFARAEYLTAIFNS
jgi:hypothetical protein